MNSSVFNIYNIVLLARSVHPAGSEQRPGIHSPLHSFWKKYVHLGSCDVNFSQNISDPALLQC